MGWLGCTLCAAGFDLLAGRQSDRERTHAVLRMAPSVSSASLRALAEPYAVRSRSGASVGIR